LVAGLDGNECQQIVDLSGEPVSVAWSPDGTRLAYTDSGGLWMYTFGADSPWQRLLANDSGASDPLAVRVYADPRWSPDGVRLLVSVGGYESASPGVVEVATGELTELAGLLTGDSAWTDDGRVLTWVAQWGFDAPGLFRLDPANPQTPPQTLLAAPVTDVVQGADGRWYVAVNSSSRLGPQFVRTLEAETPDGPFTPLSERGGGFVQMPQLIAGPDGVVLAAGLRGAAAGPTMRGELMLVDMRTGQTARFETPAPVHNVRWGPVLEQ
ncbi:MAG: hypothetical protein GYB65_09670, partial [Chloroflexi bacterium]|nr:hypothetical protein [Chloroflexota bacterium]